VGGSEAIVAHLYSVLQTAAASFLFPVVVKQFFQQVFYDIGAYLFNAMMRRTDLSASRSIAVKLELSGLDGWPENPPSQYKEVLRHVGDAGLSPMKEVCNLLLIDKSAFLARDAIASLCPTLNARYSN
jgi:hypothetical protein